MADFCSQCSPNFYDYDLFQLALCLDNGKSETLICEGCNNRGIYKDDEGFVYLSREDTKGKIQRIQIKLEELMV